MLRNKGARVEGQRIVQVNIVLYCAILYCALQDGKYWSGGGVTSGLDLALAFISSVAGRKVTGKIQLMLEYFPSQVIHTTHTTHTQHT